MVSKSFRNDCILYTVFFVPKTVSNAFHINQAQSIRIQSPRTTNIRKQITIRLIKEPMLIGTLLVSSVFESIVLEDHFFLNFNTF